METWANLTNVSFLAEPNRWILASSSPRRIQLCNLMGWKPLVLPSNFKEDYDHNDFSTPKDYAMATAQGKVMDLYNELLAGSPRIDSNLDIKYIVGADTIITIDGHDILEKPKDKDDARTMMQALSGRWHQCITGLVVLEILQHDYKIWSTYQITRVQVDAIDQDFLDAYIKYNDEYM